MNALPPGTFIIAEIGQNHNGDMNIARQLIDMAAMPIFDKFSDQKCAGVTAVKFTKRDLSEELSVEAYNRPYDSPHAFGRTYGEHREALELDYDQHVELAAYARSKGLKFVETLTSIKTAVLLERIQVDAIKVASRDLTNLPLLEELAKNGTKIILSTGMSGERDIDEALDVITKYHDRIALLHCVSQYPAAYRNINLLSIRYMQKKYPYEIGFSDHSIGIVMAPVAVALGATIIEKHITLNRSMKGSDQAGSLEPDGLWRMVRDIRNTETALGSLRKYVPEEVLPFKEKLQRSIASARDLHPGEIITEEDICLLSPGSGIPWQNRHQVIGKVVKTSVQQHSLITLEDLADE